MDALYRLLVEQYKMDPTKAQKYAEMIHKEHSNPDNLQTEAYSKVAGTSKDYADSASTDGESGNTDTVQGRMGQLAARARLFTDIHRRIQAGEQVPSEHQDYYTKVMALHQEKVRRNADSKLRSDAGPVTASNQLQGAGAGAGPSPTQGMTREQQAMRMYSPNDRSATAAQVGPPAQGSPGRDMQAVAAFHAGEGGGIPRGIPVSAGDFQFEFEKEPYADLYKRFLLQPEPTIAPPVDLPMLGSQSPEVFRQAAQNAYTKGRR